MKKKPSMTLHFRVKTRTKIGRKKLITICPITCDQEPTQWSVGEKQNKVKPSRINLMWMNTVIKRFDSCTTTLQHHLTCLSANNLVQWKCITRESISAICFWFLIRFQGNEWRWIQPTKIIARLKLLIRMFPHINVP